VADGGEDGVGGIAGSSLEVAAAEMAFGFHVAGSLANPGLSVHLTDPRAILSNMKAICASETLTVSLPTPSSGPCCQTSSLAQSENGRQVTAILGLLKFVV
jgi:hypothetical protein